MVRLEPAQREDDSELQEKKPAFREAAGRLDGKVPHAVVGDDEHRPVTTTNVSDLEAARAVAFLLRKSLEDARKRKM
jgi:hypothetical protein